MADLPPEVRTKHDDRMMCIGWVCFQWSYLEYIVLSAIRKMLDLDYETGKIVIGGTDLRPRLKLACELAQHQRRPAVLEALKKAAKAVDDGLLKRRNQAIHGLMFLYTDGEMEVEVHRGRDKARRSLSRDQLARLSDDIRETSKALNDRLAPLLWGKKPKPYAPLERPSRQSRKRKPRTQDHTLGSRQPGTPEAPGMGPKQL